MKKRFFLSCIVALGLLDAVGCSGTRLKATPDDLGDGGTPHYEPYDLEDECEIAGGTLVLVAWDLEFPVFVCEFDEEIPPSGETDSGTPPTGDDAGTPPGGENDGGTPTGETDSGLPPSGDDAGTPPTGDDAGTPPHDGGHDSGCDKPEDESRMCNRKIIVVVHSGKTTTYVDQVLQCTFTLQSDGAGAREVPGNEANVRVVRSCDHETETAETKSIGTVGKSGQLKVILSTPHRCGHYHAL